MQPQYLGNRDLLNRKLTVFLASRSVQTTRVMDCYDWATSLNPEVDCVVSGFQSPIEKYVLHFLLKKKVPVVVILGRTLYKQIPEELQEAYTEGLVLFVSISNNTRNNKAAAFARNRYVVNIAHEIVFGMLSENSSLYSLYEQLSKESKNALVL